MGYEPGSSFDGRAHLSDITVINNIFAGGKAGMLDYDDGTSAEYHGLKNCLVADNTFILGSAAVSGRDGYGWQHLFSGASPDSSRNSLVQNNIFVTAEASDRFAVLPSTGAGIRTAQTKDRWTHRASHGPSVSRRREIASTEF